MKYHKGGGAQGPEKGPEAPESANTVNGAQTAAGDFLGYSAKKPYLRGMDKYRAARWLAVVPVFPGGGVPSAFSGRGAKLPGESTYQEWGQNNGSSNLGLILPDTLIGIDVDAYGDKTGGATLAEWEAELGPLPDTFISTARRPEDMVSGIRIFRIPAGQRWIADFGHGSGIEVIQQTHRRVNAWPSVNSKISRQYRWYGLDGALLDDGVVPGPEDFPALPEAWVAALLHTGESRTSGTEHTSHTGAGMSLSELRKLPVDDPFRSSNDWLAKVAGHHAADAWGRTPRHTWTWYLDQLQADNGLSAKPHPQDRLMPTARSIWDTEAAKHPESEADELEALTQKRVMSLRADQDARRLLRREQEQETAVESLADAWQAILDGDEGDKPTVGELADDDGGLFYEGKINGVFGDGGTGKSVAMAEIQARTLDTGGIVVHWEFDNNSQRDILRRLHNAGADVGQAVKEGRFVVLRAAHELEDVAPEIVKGAALVTLDALTPAVSALGLDVNHPQGTDTALAAFLKPFTVHGAAGVFIDHVGHENKERQAGSIRKSQAVQGALYEIKSRQVPAAGQDGLAELILRKDNGPASRQKDRTAAFVNYRSLPGMRIAVTFSRDQDAEIVHQLGETEWNKRVATAEGRKEYVKELIVKALEESGASNANEVHQWLQDAGFKGKISLNAVKVAIGALIKDGAIGKDTSASGSTATGGRPTDRYRLLMPPKNPSGPVQPELDG
ncbi:bifunctional DNA primase/polymerase [Streptomyces sp. NPDC050560]|uniref:bifunctional DNA primase/polymerase n=1 Tax=Streptomyces sp. NPDC050560 TaxID=3365630 RepID=UPI0037BA37FB